MSVESLDEREAEVGNVTRTEQRTVPRRLTEFAAAAALLLVLVEIAYIRRRGDL